MNKPYDVLVTHLLDKLRKMYFGPLSDMLIPIGATHHQPTVQDVEYAALVTAFVLLHMNKVPMDTDFPDIAEVKADILKALAAFDDLKVRLKDYRDRHDAIENMASTMSSGKSFDA